MAKKNDTAPETRARKRRRAQTGGARKRVAKNSAAGIPGVSLPGSSGAVHITGSGASCQPDVKALLLPKLAHEEKSQRQWQFTFKDGDRFEGVEFKAFSTYGPPHDQMKYVLCCKLGEGSFSCVSKAWDTRAQAFVALKFTLSSAGREEYNVVAKLNQAGRLMRDANQGQTIIQAQECFDCTTARGTVILCIVMEYMPHVLTTLLTAYNPFAAQPLGVRGLTNVTKQLLQAVAFLHDRGHVHCDIKPQNILYKPCPTEDGKLDIRLADFGSCIVATRDQNDYIVTRPYRPPEVMLGLPLSSAADVWSCGCVIMELILGAPLFTSNDHFQLVTAMVELLGVPNNHVIQRAQSSDTYFCRPRALTCPEAYDHPPIPPHATVKRSRNKRSTLYYHDADSNTSTFERPTLKAEDLPQVKGQLPSFDWQMRMSSTTGNWYYANAKLGATQWQRPIRQSLRSKVEATIGGYFQVSAFCHLFSVVEKMLVWDPDERITAREAAEQIS